MKWSEIKIEITAEHCMERDCQLANEPLRAFLDRLARFLEYEGRMLPSGFSVKLKE